ncbi:DUF2269 family protein [Paenibacillus sp. 7541]|uniref:DUF2269 family protein n=1 Tax=Paenibacillus sp. 7541 TaxID=2026236 RepID=UPI000BA66BFC|nr:DUF2269 family protein [Paenibacillus sp. 7541]PAK47950.1 hypothetical protein CHH75_23770 [Paenibacillus sp. 7541]
MGMWLIVHLIGVLLMVGNVVTAAFWKIKADQTGNPHVIHHTAKQVMLADYVFTIPGLALIILSGGVMAGVSGFSWSGLNWLTLSLGLFAVTGVIWLAVLIPLQRTMIRLSSESAKSGVISAEYKRASRLWAIYGTAATLLPLVILYLMVMKGF